MNVGAVFRFFLLWFVNERDRIVHCRSQLCSRAESFPCVIETRGKRMCAVETVLMRIAENGDQPCRELYEIAVLSGINVYLDIERG